MNDSYASETGNLENVLAIKEFNNFFLKHSVNNLKLKMADCVS